MSPNRREFVGLTAGSLAMAMLPSSIAITTCALGATVTRFKVLLFDAFPILDPRPVFVLAEELFPGKGSDLSNTWRTRQFEYTWLRSISQKYEDFWKVTEDALVFAASAQKLDLTAENEIASRRPRWNLEHGLMCFLR